MNKFRRTRSFLVLLLVVMLMATTASAVFADDADNGTVDLTVLHRINGEDLGLDKALPVDVCVNGEFAFTFEYGDKVKTDIPAGEYTFEVYLEAAEKCAGDPVLSAGPAELPAGSKVVAKAALLGGEPTLAVKVYEKDGKK